MNKFQHVSTVINSCQQSSTVVNRFQQLSTNFNSCQQISTVFNKLQQSSTNFNTPQQRVNRISTKFQQNFNRGQKRFSSKISNGNQKSSEFQNRYYSVHTNGRCAHPNYHTINFISGGRAKPFPFSCSLYAYGRTEDHHLENSFVLRTWYSELFSILKFV